jgi:four helix bundle protein
MSGLERFEDLVAWQKARQLANQIYKATSEEPFCHDFGLSRQIQRAAVSVMSNIAEGFDRNGSAEFHQFLSTAKASCAEVRSHLYIALDVGYLSPQSFDKLIELAEEVSKIIGGLRSYMRSIAVSRAANPGQKCNNRNSELRTRDLILIGGQCGNEGSAPSPRTDYGGGDDHKMA